MPAAAARSAVRPSTIAPASSVPPSEPSVSMKAAATSLWASPGAAASAASWFGPPLPNSSPAPSLTVLSPPQPISTVGGANGRPSSALSNASRASRRPTGPASSSRPVERMTGSAPARRASTAIASHAVSPVTSRTEWTSTALRSGTSSPGLSRWARTPAATSPQRSRLRRIAVASAGVESLVTLGSVIASRASPATSETVRLISRAGATAIARRPPLKPETCFRTVLISEIGRPAPSRSRCSSLLSAAETPAGGRLVRAELPPVKQAMTMSRSPSSPARSSSRTAAATLRSSGIGCAASSSSIRSGRTAALPSRTTTVPPSSRSPRIRSRASAIFSVALPEPRTTTRPSGWRA